jgi:hypothetical protein
MRNLQMKDEKTIFIRCSGETKKLLQAIKKSENRSENAQVIHMIHKEAERLGITVEKEPPVVGYDANGSPTTEVAERKEMATGLRGLAENSERGNYR